MISDGMIVCRRAFYDKPAQIKRTVSCIRKLDDWYGGSEIVNPNLTATKPTLCVLLGTRITKLY